MVGFCPVCRNKSVFIGGPENHVGCVCVVFRLFAALLASFCFLFSLQVFFFCTTISTSIWCKRILILLVFIYLYIRSLFVNKYRFPELFKNCTRIVHSNWFFSVRILNVGKCFFFPGVGRVCRPPWYPRTYAGERSYFCEYLPLQVFVTFLLITTETRVSSYAEGYLVRFLIVSFLGGTQMEGVASVLLLAFKADLNDERCKEQDQES